MPPASSKPSRSDIRLFSRRLLIVKLVVIIGIAVLIGRLAWLQIYRHELYSGLSTNNSIRANFLTPIRGRVYDRDGQILATNQPAFSLEVLPSAANDTEALVDAVDGLIGLSEEEKSGFYERLAQTPLDGVNTAWLKEDLTRTELAIIASQLHRLNGLSIGNFLGRVYPDGPATSAVLGHMGRITPEDWQRLDQNRYARNGHIGKTGLENEYEDKLYGRPGYSYVEVDAHGRIHRELDRKAAQPGMDLHTSLSLDLQRSAVEALQDYRGAIVAMIPASGEVLALHSSPSYDNNRRLSSVMDSSEDQQAADKPLFNRATSGVYPPASTIKPILALHPSLQETLPVEEAVSCPGYMRIGRRRYRDWKRSGHGKTDLIKAIAESCDVYFYHNALLLGVEGLGEAMRMLGFGEPTGIDLPTESSGLVPTEQWKQERYDDIWRDGDSANAGIGQGFVLATPLQMAVAVSTLANRGRWVRPRLFRSWEEPTAAGDPEPGESDGELGDAQTRALPEEWLQRLPAALEGMRAVVHSDEGTGRRLRKMFEAMQVEAAGKTGTAQVVRLRRESSDEDALAEHKDHSMFIGFAPFESPLIAVAVVVENAGNGSAVAAPIAGRLMREWLERAYTPPVAEAASIDGPDGEATVDGEAAGADGADGH